MSRWPVLLVLALAASACIEGKTRPPDGAADGAPDGAADGPADGVLLDPPVDGDLGPTPGWVIVPPGKLLMGPRAGNPCAAGAQRKVTLTRRFQLAATEVTRGEFDTLMGYHPSPLGPPCETCPVVVSWYEAAAYCNSLSSQAGLPGCYQCAGAGKTLTCALDSTYTAAAQKTIYDCPGYRLPTEAEWEHAYRAGTQTDLYNGDITETKCAKPDPAANLIAWYCRFAGDHHQPVKKKQPNGRGLYDMAGNAWEWCADGYLLNLGSTAAVDPWNPGPINNRHAQRGGDYFERACQVRAVARRERMPTEYGGFRCSRTLP